MVDLAAGTPDSGRLALHLEAADGAVLSECSAELALK
jgi:hypothetical protein